MRFLRPFVASVVCLLTPVAACQSSSDTAGGPASSDDAGSASHDATSISSPDSALDATSVADATSSADATLDSSLADPTRDSSVADGTDAASGEAASDAASVPDANTTCPADGGADGVWCDRSIASGVVWRSIRYGALFCGAQRINVIDVDLTQPGLSVRPVQGSGGTYETVSAMGVRTGAIAGINGGFFCNGSDDICTLAVAQPTCDVAACSGTDAPASGACTEPSGLSLLELDGGVVSTNCKTARATLGLDLTGRAPSISEVAAGTPAPQPNAIGAGPILVVAPDAGSGPGTASVADEAFHWPCTTHPRTAVAIDDRGHLLLVTFDGGNGASGVTLAQAASFLVTELNARQAMNFDGGGSTTLYVRGYGAANVPSTDGSDGGAEERAVYDGLFVFGP